MSQGLSEYAEVAIPLGVYGTFTYRIPDALKDELRLGARVEVPWGPKLTTAFVVGFRDEAGGAKGKVRDIRAILDEEEPALLPEIIDLCIWAAGYYIAPLGEMLRVALPANMAARGRRRAVYAANAASVDAALAEKRVVEGDLALLRAVESEPREIAAIVREFPGSRGALARLRDAGLITIADRLSDIRGVRFDRFAILETRVEGLPAKQQAVVDLLAGRGGEMPARAIEREASAASLATLVRKAIVRIEKRPRQHTLDAFLANLEASRVGDLTPTREQREAIAAIREALGRFATFLLQGVTGSGKTEVYIEAMREVVRRGEQAIFLVPEISLTPVLAARLKERFGERIAILHSNLSPSERYDQWWRARRGSVDVAIGPRSALFTPFPRLGLIIVDEEGDAAYKQEETPRYNARDLAVVRARLGNIPAVLGSATPSLETRENAATGKYRHLRLETRVQERSLPEVEVIDLRKERGEKEDRGLVIFSRTLREEMARVFAAGEQAIILINRRGYAPFLLCRECENDFRCRDCSVALTVHRREGQLICHYCGLRRGIPSKCPLCGGEVLHPIGFGTERVEERFRKHFPEVTVDVLDRDIIRKKGELVRILDRFRSGATQALIGTQIISKGHDFPNVTLTAVINADSILGFPDFRSAEKTFYLLTQVAGRSGRGDIPGRVAIQSGFPNHYAIQHAIRHDYESFFTAEMEFRTRFHYPPATSMIAILFRGEDLRKVEHASRETGATLEAAARAIPEVRIQGPAPAPLARIKGVHRFQILIRSAQRAALRKAVEQAVLAKSFAGVDVVVDVDPINIL